MRFSQHLRASQSGLPLPRLCGVGMPTWTGLAGRAVSTAQTRDSHVQPLGLATPHPCGVQKGMSHSYTTWGFTLLGIYIYIHIYIYTSYRKPPHKERSLQAGTSSKIISPSVSRARSGQRRRRAPEGPSGMTGALNLPLQGGGFSREGFLLGFYKVLGFHRVF